MNILQNKKLIAIIASAIAFVLIFALVLSLTMCNRAELVDASAVSSELSSEAASVEESSEPSEEQPAISSEDETPSKTPSIAPSKPAESSASAGRTQEEIDRLVSEAMLSGNGYNIKLYIKEEHWEKKKNWTKEDFSKVEVRAIENMGDFLKKPLLFIDFYINTDTELEDVIRKLYSYEFVDIIERSKTVPMLD
jgi:hypothetical protein